MRKWQQDLGSSASEYVEEIAKECVPNLEKKYTEKPTAREIVNYIKLWIEQWTPVEFTITVFCVTFILLLAFKPFIIQRQTKHPWETRTNYFLALILSALTALGYYVALLGGL